MEVCLHGCSCCHPKDQAFALPPKNRESRPIDALGTQHVDVIQGGKLFRCECLSRAEDHVTSVMNYDIEPSILRHNLLNRLLNGVVGGNIYLYCSKIAGICCREFLDALYLGSITSSSLAHSRVHDMSGLG